MNSTRLWTTTIALQAMLLTSPLAAQEAPILSMEGLAQDFASPAGRFLIGRGEDYVPVGGATDSQVLFDQLKQDMKARRDFAWQVVDQMLQPTTVTLPASGIEVDVPLWQTWYDGSSGSDVGTNFDELTGLFTSFFEKLTADPTADLEQAADETLDEQGQKNLAASITEENFTTVLRQNVDEFNVSTEFGGQGSTMFSPSFVKHMMVSAQGVENCSFASITPDRDPPSAENFSHCIREFPRNAVMVKTSWRKLDDRVAVHNTSAGAMTHAISEGTWPGGALQPTRPPTARPSSDQIYTNATADGTEWGLAGIHFVTKDVREWVWVSLWWSPEPGADFGADRPAGIAAYNNGVWSNYKMCVVSSFDEGDAEPWSHYATGASTTLGDAIKATYDAIQNHVDNGVQGQMIIGVDDRPGFPPPGARGPWPAPHDHNTTWCSNPFIEIHLGNARTSCIGCHQLVLTESAANPAVSSSFTEAMFGSRPQFARSRSFKNFSTDFSWGFQLEFQDLIERAREDAGFAWP